MYRPSLRRHRRFFFISANGSTPARAALGWLLRVGLGWLGRERFVR
jgi:hypothetical protein